MGIYEELEWRGLIKDVSDPSLREKLNAGGMTFYIGTDPTGDSLHIGHFSSFLISKRLADAGHHPILLVGGATGLIGDPKPSAERQMITREEVEKNVEGLTKQAKEIFGFDITMSFGVSDLTDKTMQEAIKEADAAMYKSKETGRNKVTIYQLKRR
jgi:tyrosyl-tRNA synthetase